MEKRLEWLRERQKGIGGSDIGASQGLKKKKKKKEMGTKHPRKKLQKQN